MRHDNVPPHSSPIRPKYAHRHKPMPDAPTGQKGREVSALMGSVQVAYAFDKTWGVVASFDYLSGDKGNGDKFKAFDPLYGTHHKFYGSMDYFYANLFVNGYARFPLMPTLSQHPYSCPSDSRKHRPDSSYRAYR